MFEWCVSTMVGEVSFEMPRRKQGIVFIGRRWGVVCPWHDNQDKGTFRGVISVFDKEEGLLLHPLDGPR